MNAAKQAITYEVDVEDAKACILDQGESLCRAMEREARRQLGDGAIYQACTLGTGYVGYRYFLTIALNGGHDAGCSVVVTFEYVAPNSCKNESPEDSRMFGCGA